MLLSEIESLEYLKRIAHELNLDLSKKKDFDLCEAMLATMIEKFREKQLATPAKQKEVATRTETVKKRTGIVYTDLIRAF